MISMRNRIPITKSLIPYRFQILLGDTMYTLEMKYNVCADIFTVGLIRDGVLLAVEPLVYGMPLFRDSYVSGRFPTPDLVPFDESGTADTVSISNFGETVFLTVDDEVSAE